jgi:hypothetical protein
MKLFDIIMKLFNTTPTTSEVVARNISDGKYRISQALRGSKVDKHIICNGKPVKIDWSKVVLWDEPGGLICEPNQYRSRKTNRRVKMFLLHWDACLDSRSMAGVLKARGLSVQFAIDNDGTIYQLMDTKHVAWHAKGVNNISVGVEIANAVLPKHQAWYKKNLFGLRPVIEEMKVHGKKLSKHLGFYSVQEEALKALTRAVCEAHDIPFETPVDADGNLIMGVDPRVTGRTFKGVAGHFQVTTRKVDPAGLEFDKIVQELKEESA